MKKIEFYPFDETTEIVVPPPQPAKNITPDWYNTIRPFDGEKPIYDSGKVVNKTIKFCLPFSDALSHGYIQETWCDIHIEMKNGVPHFNYSNGPQIIDIRGDLKIKTFEEEFYNYDFVWRIPWLPKLPKGYSALFVHPINRFDLPFYSNGAIIDSDSFYLLSGGNYPFLLKKNFEGIIPKGTPMYQIIPIKRSSWTSSKAKYDYVADLKFRSYIRSYFYGGYKKVCHVKKSFK